VVFVVVTVFLVKQKLIFSLFTALMAQHYIPIFRVGICQLLLLFPIPSYLITVIMAPTTTSKSSATLVTTTTTTITATSIGRGELERQKDHNNNNKSVGLERFTVKWLSYKNDSTVTNATTVMDNESSLESDDDDDDDDVLVMIDLTTDNAYHSKEEYKGCQKIIQALTEEEFQSMPDWAMPLRHYRAEKVRTV
jgi:hypothetical protein